MKVFPVPNFLRTGEASLKNLCVSVGGFNKKVRKEGAGALYRIHIRYRAAAS
ncbi:MAG: hypothetical protein IKM28_03175 [Lachnospiraceae bacterium]|nr:hypothetical protein [Lachnospiraceae bacterium]